MDKVMMVMYKVMRRCNGHVHLLQGPVSFRVQCPNMMDKSEWKLTGQTFVFTLPLIDTVGHYRFIQFQIPLAVIHPSTYHWLSYVYQPFIGTAHRPDRSYMISYYMYQFKHVRIVRQVIVITKLKGLANQTSQSCSRCLITGILVVRICRCRNNFGVMNFGIRHI